MSNAFFIAGHFFLSYKADMSTDRERFTTTINGFLLRHLKILAINERCTTNRLLDEAIKDLLAKYQKKTPKSPPLFPDD